MINKTQGRGGSTCSHLPILFTGILFATNLFANSWERAYGGTEGDIGRSVQQTTDGGFIVAGGTSSFGAGYEDVYLLKIDSNGDTLWTKTFGGSGNDYGISVKQTKDGGYIITGATASYGTSVKNVYLIKTDSIGDTLWTRVYDNEDYNEGESVQQTADGGYIIAGVSYNSGTGGNMNIYFLKTDSSGDTLWTKTYSNASYYYRASVQAVSGGKDGFIIAGGKHPKIYLIRTDSLGDTLWTKAYGGTPQLSGASIRQTSDSGFIIAGERYLGDVCLLKINSNGDSLWTSIYGGLHLQFAYDVQECFDKGFIVVGGNGECYGEGSWYGLYLTKTDSVGSLLWEKTFGLPTGYSVQQCADSGYIITGASNGGDVYVLKTGQIGVEESKELKVQSPELRVIKNKIYLSLSNDYYPSTLITIYDLTGRLKETVYSGTLTKGNYTFTPNIHKSGIYFVRLSTICHSDTERSEGEESNIITETKKLILVK